MTTWTSDELKRIGTAEELEIASRRHDNSLQKPVTIWVVRVGDDLYVRSVKGQVGGWFRGTQVRHEGRIWAGGLERDVTFIEETGSGINDQVDEAYRTKYHHYEAAIVSSMVRPDARATTIKLMPLPKSA